MATPNIDLPTVPNGQTNISAAFNDAMQLIDALLHLTVEDKDLSAPPATVSGDVGKRWIIGAAPTGDWAGHAGKIALCTAAGLWRIIPAREGYEAWVIDEGAKYRYESGTWTAV